MKRLLICLGLIGATPGFFAAQDRSPAAMMARIEGPQSPDRQGLDALTLMQVLERAHVPGISIAVIDNFVIHWDKGYGIAECKAVPASMPTRCSRRHRSANRWRRWPRCGRCRMDGFHWTPTSTAS